jgi:predicted solute-binding protein
MERVLKKVSLKEADKLDIEFWKSKTPEERLDVLQYLREIYYEFKNEDRKRFQRVYKVIKQK